MTTLCFAMQKSAARLYQMARRVEKSEPERAEMLKSLAKADAKEADEIANKQATSRKELC